LIYIKSSTLKNAALTDFTEVEMAAYHGGAATCYWMGCCQTCVGKNNLDCLFLSAKGSGVYIYIYREMRANLVTNLTNAQIFYRAGPLQTDYRAIKPAGHIIALEAVKV
jgi:hypothetical protein